MMKKSHEIRLFFLSIAYFVVLSTVIMPHHHHDEIACYQSTHCESDAADHDHPADSPDDHHHHSSAGEGSEHCISLENYVIAEPGKNIRRHIDLLVNGHTHQHLTDACAIILDEDSELTGTFLLSKFIVHHNSFIDFQKIDSQLRAPPAKLA